VFGAFVVGLFQERENPKDLHYPFMGLWARGPICICIGAFALGFDPKETQGLALFF
jgi:hypothetical protein